MQFKNTGHLLAPVTVHQSKRTQVLRAKMPESFKKVIVKQSKTEKHYANNLVKEYRILKQLDNAFLPKPIDIIHTDTFSCIVFEDDGLMDLKALLPEEGFKIKEFLDIAILILKAVSYLHNNKIVHKDINPGNVIVDTKFKSLKLIDLELATYMQGEDSVLKSPENLDASLNYISPELTGRVNRQVDYRSDLYSLGITFHEMLTGKLPFEFEDPLELIHAHIAKKPPSVSEINLSIPTVISEIILKLLSKDAEERYQSAKGVMHDLKKCRKQFVETKAITTFNLAEKDFITTFRLSEKLYSRQKEISILKDVFERTAEGIQNIVFVSGPSGVGKTALVNELHKPMTERRGDFLAGKFNQYQKDIPYYFFRQAFGKYLQSILLMKEDRVSKWRENILSNLGANGQLIIDIIPELKLLIGDQPEVPKVGETEQQNRFENVFINFIKAFCFKDNPLVLFIDDLQWCDLSSLRFLKRIIFGSQINYLMIVCAYRDDEMEENHLFSDFLSQVMKSNLSKLHLKLSDLREKDVQHLLKDTFNSDFSEDIVELSKVIYQKTSGNPFFTKQFILNLVKEKFIYQEPNKSQWVWNVKTIRKKNITSNVLALMLQKVSSLPHDAYQLMFYASCIGNQFNSHFLAGLTNYEHSELIKNIQICIDNGIIVPLSSKSEEDILKGEPDYKFLHDRIQQAAYSKGDSEEKKQIHLQIGRYYLSMQNDDDSGDSLLYYADQFLMAIDYVTDNKEKEKIADLFLNAGKKAIHSAAYESALLYLQNGQKCLSDNWVSDQRDSGNEIYLKMTLAASLLGDFRLMDSIIKERLSVPHSLEEEVQFRIVQIQSLIAQNCRKEAINIALDFLKKLDVEFNYTPTAEQVSNAFMHLNQLLEKQSTDQILGLPGMKDSVSVMCMQIITATISAAFVVSPSLMILMIIKEVELSLLYGNLPESAYAYGFYGVVLCGVLNEIDSGYRFGKLSKDVLRKLNNKSMQTRVDHIFYDLVLPCKKHIYKSLHPLFTNYENGVELGDFEFAAYSVHIYSLYLFCSGDELVNVTSEISDCNLSLIKLNQNDTLSWNKILLQVVYNLTQQVDDPCEINGEIHNRDEMVPVYMNSNDKMAINYYYLFKGILNYLFKNAPLALSDLSKVKANLDGATGKYTVALYYFYDSLIKLHLYNDVSPDEQKVFLADIDQNQDKMSVWASISPSNYLHKYQLVEAEKLRIAGDFKALEWYEKSIKNAHANHFIQEEALVLELASECCDNFGMDRLSTNYINDAYIKYGQWGARTKCIKMKSDNPDKILDQDVQNPATTLLSGISLDNMSILKASQVISGEMEYNQLQDKLLSIVIENAGADKGALIIDDKGFRIKAIKSLHFEKTEFDEQIDFNKSRHIPGSLIKFVLKTGQELKIDNASDDYQYNKISYINAHQTKSVLIIPIKYNHKITGILYLENSQISGVFSEDRVHVIRILTSQAAISIENAKLFRDINEERNYTNKLIENSSGLICGINQHGNTTFINPVVESITGYTKGEIVGKNWWKLVYPGDEYRQVEKLFEQLPHIDVIDYPMVITCKNGEKRTILWNSYIIKDQYGEIEEIVGFGNDVTTLKRSENELKRLNGELKENVLRISKINKQLEKSKIKAQESDRLKSAFLANMSHEIRTPMNGILGFAELMANPNLSREKITQYIDVIHTSGNRLMNTINDILDISHIETGQVNISLEKISLCTEIERIITFLKPEADKKGIAFRFYNKLPKEQCIILTDQVKINSIIINLVKNAVKFTFKGHVHLYLEKHDQEILFTVEDTGIGISKDDQKFIFERFIQAEIKDNITREGSGLGLAISKSYIHILGGKIRVESTPGKGSKFYMHLNPHHFE